eukprot:TRINITY_DN20312_c0_g1_i1.p1 TRINITY_DN20312_c0_g1~~TRINITY_DN20312_c0_g1_i1.p1  ORF type:complete len:381 (+),score=88.12 TRINITY_DN20312_c0_g1_i1:65-1144(+)
MALRRTATRCCKFYTKTSLGETRGTDATGMETAQNRDVFPTRHKYSAESTVHRQVGRLTARGPQMDAKHGWDLAAAVNQYRQVQDPAKTEQPGTGDAWRFNWGQEMTNQAGREGLELFLQQKRGELRQAAIAKQKPIPSTADRTDIAPWMHWTVPPKKVRLELFLAERARRLQKTPEYDLNGFQKAMLQRMNRLLEKAIMFNPLPFPNSRENFAITHIECVYWHSLELWIVCWCLTLDESQRPRYENILNGSISSRWAQYVRMHWGRVGSRMLIPVLHFHYDDGAIPYKRSIVERNIDRVRQGLSPLPMDRVPREQWGLNVTPQELKGATAEDYARKSVRFSPELKGGNVFTHANEMGL